MAKTRKTAAQKVQTGDVAKNVGRSMSGGKTRQTRQGGLIGGRVDGDGTVGTGNIVEAAPGSPHQRQAPRQNALIALLSREDGASIAEIAKALVWLPHTSRAALTGLRKKAYTIERLAGADGRASRYRIASMQCRPDENDPAAGLRSKPVSRARPMSLAKPENPANLKNPANLDNLARAGSNAITSPALETRAVVKPRSGVKPRPGPRHKVAN